MKQIFFRSLTLSALIFLATTPAQSEIVVPGYNVENYAAMTGPLRMTFDGAGVMYVGREVPGGGGPAPAKIYRVEAGGGTVSEYGNQIITDPDSVLFDEFGLISGVPDSVLVGGNVQDGTQVTAIHPNESVQQVLFWSNIPGNPSDVGEMLFDSNGRLLFSGDGGRVFSQVSGITTLLISGNGIDRNGSFAVDTSDQIYRLGTDGSVRVYNASGNLIDASFASGTGLRQLTYSTGGPFGEGLFALTATDLVRVDAGSVTSIGSGFSGVALMTFGPDDALYVSRRDEDRIVRITAVPEPTSFALLSLFGVVATTIASRRRRRIAYV